MRGLPLPAVILLGAAAAAGAERYGPESVGAWVQDAMTWDGYPVDVSFLNDKPAGVHGFVRADGDSLYFEDGTPVNFWGCNVAASALFGAKPEMKAMARRIAALGFNLVRIHHQDSMRWVKPNIIDATKNHTRDLNRAALDRLDYFIACLKEEGVYLYYDLHVGRVFKAGDGIKRFAEMSRRQPGGKAYCYMDTDIQKLMQEHSRKVLTHVNPYTRLSYARDPAFAFFLISNENDVANNLGNSFLADKGVPSYWAMFSKAAREYARREGLSPERVVRTWEPGDAKIFLAHLEKKFFRTMSGHLRSLGVKVPIVGTNWAYGGLWCLPGGAEAADVLDNHVYDGGGSFLVMDPQRQASFMMRVASAHVAGKPFAVSEWNIVYERNPERTPVHRASCSIGLAALGAHQGWDAPMIYNYRQTRAGKPRRLSSYDTLLDPALMGAMPSAAMVFRRDVRESPNTYVLLARRSQIYHERWRPEGGRRAKAMIALRTGIERQKTVVALEKVPPGLSNPTVVPLDKNLLEGKTSVRSDTGQITRDWKRGLQTIDTPGSQVAQGFYGGQTVKLSSVTFKPRNAFSVIAVSSLTRRSVGLSDRNLIYAISQCRKNRNKVSYSSQTVTGTVTVRFKRRPAGAALTPLFGNGRRGAKKRLSVGADGSVTVDLGAAGRTHWFLLEADFGGAAIPDDLVPRGRGRPGAPAGRTGTEARPGPDPGAGGRERVVEMLLKRVPGHPRRIALAVFGTRRRPVTVTGANRRALKIRSGGSTIPLPWKQVSDRSLVRLGWAYGQDDAGALAAALELARRHGMADEAAKISARLKRMPGL